MANDMSGMPAACVRIALTPFVLEYLRKKVSIARAVSSSNVVQVSVHDAEELINGYTPPAKAACEPLQLELKI